tara:strand:- start:2970 stop:3986 length:1017 start_codon:yes stop_codon:yes gene_type:complete
MPVIPHKYPASWVDEQDRIVLELSTSLYTEHITSKDGWELVNRTASVAAWVRGEDAIVGIMGTSAKTGLSNLLDDAALAGVVDGSCDLAVVNQAEAIIEGLQDKNIIVAGHSLGGAAAFCVSHKGNVTRAVAFNPGAPPTGGGLKGGQNCRAYHIVGDIISTHINDSTADVTRVHLHGEVNWNNVTYYHSTDRFFENKSYDIWHAQEEQDSLVKYIYNQSPTTALLTLVTGLITKELNKDRIREIVCKNPIPGTRANCPDIPNAGQVLTTFAGGLLGLAGGPAGVLAGLKLGYDIGGGSGLLDILAPGGVDKIKRGFKRALQVGQNVNRTLSKRPRLR